MKGKTVFISSSRYPALRTADSPIHPLDFGWTGKCNATLQFGRQSRQKKELLGRTFLLISLIRHVPHIRRQIQIYYFIVACVFVAAITLLSSRCLTTIEIYTCRHTVWLEGFMKHVLAHVPWYPCKFHKDRLRHSKVDERGGIHWNIHIMVISYAYFYFYKIRKLAKNTYYWSKISLTNCGMRISFHPPNKGYKVIFPFVIRSPTFALQGRSVKLAIHHLIPHLRMSGAVLPLILTSPCSGAYLTRVWQFYFQYIYTFLTVAF
jgi:hypothetical protein